MNQTKYSFVITKNFQNCIFTFLVNEKGNSTITSTRGNQVTVKTKRIFVKFLNNPNVKLEILYAKNFRKKITKNRNKNDGNESNKIHFCDTKKLSKLHFDNFKAPK